MATSVAAEHPNINSSSGLYDLHVGGIPNGVNAQTLGKALSLFGPVQVVWVHKASNRKARFFALVRCADASTRNRILNCSGSLFIEGYPLRVQLCVPSKLVKTTQAQLADNPRMSSPQQKPPALSARHENVSNLGSQLSAKPAAESCVQDKENRRKSFQMAATAAAIAMASPSPVHRLSVKPALAAALPRCQAPSVKSAPSAAQPETNRREFYIKKSRNSSQVIGAAEMAGTGNKLAKPSLRVRSQRRLSSMAAVVGTVIQYARRDKNPAVDTIHHASSVENSGQEQRSAGELSRCRPNSDAFTLPEEYHTANGDTLPTLSLYASSGHSGREWPQAPLSLQALANSSFPSVTKQIPVHTDSGSAPQFLASENVHDSAAPDGSLQSTEMHSGPNLQLVDAQVLVSEREPKAFSIRYSNLQANPGFEIVKNDPGSTASTATWGVPRSPNSAHRHEFLRAAGFDVGRKPYVDTKFSSVANGKPEGKNFGSYSSLWSLTGGNSPKLAEDTCCKNKTRSSRSDFQGPKARILVIQAPAMVDLNKVRALVAQHGSIETWDAVQAEGAYRIYATMSSPEQAYLASIQLKDSLPKLSSSCAYLG